MLEHVVMLTLVEDTSHEQRDAIARGLRALPGQVPGLQRIEVRLDEGLADGNAAVVFHMSFVDEDAWRAYTPHPAHKALANELILPVLLAKTAMQYHSPTPSRTDASISDRLSLPPQAAQSRP